MARRARRDPALRHAAGPRARRQLYARNARFRPDPDGRFALVLAAEEDLLRDHEPLDLRGALVDLEQLRVAHELLDRVLLDVAVAAEHLDGVGRDLHRRVGGEALRERRVERRLPPVPVVEHPGRLPRQEPCRLDLGRHVGDQEVDALVHGDRHVEGDALLGVIDRVLVGRLRDADCARRRAGPRADRASAWRS